MSSSLFARGLRKIRRKQEKSRKMEARQAYKTWVRTLPIQEDLVLLEARNGHTIDGNVYYILQELLTGEGYPEFSIALTAEDPAAEERIRGKLRSMAGFCGDAPAKAGGDPGMSPGMSIEEKIARIRIVQLHSKEYYRVMASAGYLVNDASFANFFIKKAGQTYVNVWHGTPLKAMGRRVSHEPHATGNVQKNFIVADYLLYPSEYMMEHMIEDYMIEGLSRAEILLGGYPRNSVFFDEAGREKVRRDLLPDGAEGMRIYAYMPTWRPTLMGESLQQVLRQIEEGLEQDEIMYVNIHPLAEETVDFSGFKKIRQFPRDMEVYTFLNAADALLTDYSSVFYDFAVTGRSIVLLTYDEKEYFATRGLYEPIASLPFPQVATVEEALEALRRPREYDDSAFLKKYCSYESPDAARELCRAVFLKDGGPCGPADHPERRVADHLERRAMPDPGLPNVLVWGGDLAPGPRRDAVMQYLADPGKPAANYLLTFNRKDLQDHFEVLFDLPEGISYIGRAGALWLDPEEQEADDRYRRGKLSFPEWWEKLRPAFALERKRYYGDMRIDGIVQIPEGKSPGPGCSPEELEFAVMQEDMQKGAER